MAHMSFFLVLYKTVLSQAPTSPHFGVQNCTSSLTSWRDGGGYDCEAYEANQWCVDGEVGSNWDSSTWGSFADVANRCNHSHCPFSSPLIISSLLL